MVKSIIQNILAFSLVLLIFTGGYVLGQSRLAPVQLFGPRAGTPQEAEEAFRPFWETWQLIHNEYYDQPVADSRLVEGAIQGMLDTLDDPNTRYLSPEQEEAARNSMAGHIEGIGAEVEAGEGESIIIVAPYEGSPAEAAGLRSGDIIRAADGVALTGMDLTAAAALVRGPKGTTVRLRIERDGALFEVDVARDVIQVPSVKGELLDNGLAYVRLSRFGNETAEELQDTLAQLMAHNPSGLILDLRGNPGGNLPTAVDVADEFLAEGTVLIERFGNGRETVFESKNRGLAQDISLVILLDGGSASASEVVAGAVQDRGRGVLIGEPTYGKGTVQSWHRLSNDGGVRITVARWLTPDGRWLNETGLEPDYLVSLPDSEEGAAVTDTQLEAAVDYLLGQPVTVDQSPLPDQP
jgi:carboxyl-terminal processing protease